MSWPGWYQKDGRSIYRDSFAAIRAEANLAALQPGLAQVVVRMIHASGSVDIAGDVEASEQAIAAARAALRHGAPVLCDATMVASGVTRARLPGANQVICTLRDPRVPELAEELGTTRSAAAVRLWADRIEGAVVAIGNAPTALFHLLELLRDDQMPQPAAILGLPVGFIGAAESKSALAKNPLGLQFLVVHGRRGGSAMAAAAVNAIASDTE